MKCGATGSIATTLKNRDRPRIANPQDVIEPDVLVRAPRSNLPVQVSGPVPSRWTTN